MNNQNRNTCYALVTEVHPNREDPIFCGEKTHFSLHNSFHDFPSYANFKRVAELQPDGKHVPITHPGELLWKNKDNFNYLKGSLPKDYVVPNMFNSFVNDVAEVWTDTKKSASSYTASAYNSSTVKVENSLGHIYDASQLKPAKEFPIYLSSDSDESSLEDTMFSSRRSSKTIVGVAPSKCSASSKSHLVKVTYEKGSKDAIPISLHHEFNGAAFNSCQYKEIFVYCNHFKNYSLPLKSSPEKFDGNLSSYFPVGSIWSSSKEVLSQLKRLSSKFLGYDSVNKRSSSSFICSNAKDHNCGFKLNLIAVCKYTSHEDNSRRHLWDHCVKISSFNSHSESCLTKKKREIVLESSSSSSTKKKSKPSIPSQWNVCATPSFLVPNIIETEISKALTRYIVNIKHAILLADVTKGENTAIIDDTAIAKGYRHCLESLLHVITHDNTISFETLNSPGSAAFLDTVRNLKSYSSIGPAMISVLCWLQSCNLKENSNELEVKLIGKQFISQHYMNWKQMNAVFLRDHLNYKSV